MCGGKGTRLRPFTNVLPKPLVPLGDASVLEMVLKQLRHFGFSKVVLAVGYKAEIIMAVIGDGKRFGLEVTYHVEDKPLGTMGALSGIEGLEENFIVTNGDICTDMNFGDFYQSHVSSGATATVGTYNRREKIELGVITIDGSEGAITGFQEKPEFDFKVAMGVNAFNRSILSLIPDHKFFGFDDLMHAMIAGKIDVRSYLFEGLWHDIGRADDYTEVATEFDQNASKYLPPQE